MIPIKDNIPSRTAPVVNYLVIALCTLAFFVQLGEEHMHQGTLIERYGLIPVRVVDPDRPVLIKTVAQVRTPTGIRLVEQEQLAASPPFSPWLTLLTSMFLHGGWMHFLGNMWFLYIFGDNVEDRFGHFGYFVFYIVCGLAAGLTHLVTNLSSSIPTIGASGAIAGVMGAYFLLYPMAMVLTVLPIFFFLQIVVVPASLFLGLWFLIQFFQGTFAVAGTEVEGVAWWAHVGGFVAGAALAMLLRSAGMLNPRVETILPHTERVSSYRYGQW